MVQNVWRVEFFGGLVAERGDRRISHFRSHNTGLLLATLAQDPGRPQWRDELSTRLWPEHDLPSSRNGLRIALSSLRTQLEPEIEDHGRIIVADRSQIFLNPECIVTDHHSFQSCLKDAARALDPRTEASHLRQAIEQYHTGFLPAYNEPWIAAERKRIEDVYILALRRLVRAYINLREYSEAMLVARQAVEADPTRKESQELLFRVYAQLGRPGAAILYLEQLKSGTPRQAPQFTLTESLIALDGQAHDSDGGAGRLSNAIPYLQRIAEDLQSQPEPDFELQFRHSFRKVSTAQVYEMLDTPETKLVTITGLAGIGKTHLARAVAEHLRGQESSVTFVPLGSVVEAGFIVSSIALALGLTPPPIQTSLWDHLCAALRGKKLLFILDHVDHLLPEAGEIIARLLKSNRTLRCLITCRERLHIRGEYEHSVRPLAIPRNLPDLELMDIASCAMWLERVQLAHPSYHLTPTRSKGVRAISRRLDGMPLAIELAAACNGIVPPTRITAELDDLVATHYSHSGSRDQVNMSVVTLDWTWRRLSEIERSVLTRLSVFRGGWTLQAAQKVCKAGATSRVMAELARRCQISTGQLDGAARSIMSETVREFASNALPKEAQLARKHHFLYYSQLAIVAEAESTGPNQSSWFTALTIERDNLRAALRYGIANKKHNALALQLCCALFWYWYVGGEREEGRAWLESALEQSQDASPEMISKAFTAIGNLSDSAVE